MPPFKDEHIMIIAPGSRTTLAQLGLPETFTPAQFRCPTRMFPGASKGEWEPHLVREKTEKIVRPEPTQSTAPESAAGAVTAPAPAEAAADAPEEDEEKKKKGEEEEGNSNGKQRAEEEEDDDDAAQPTEMKEDVEMTEAPSSANDEEGEKVATEEEQMEEEEQIVFQEDPTSDKGAVYPIQGGRIVNFDCFFSLITHIYNKLSPPFHTPVLMIAQPVWTSRDHHLISQFMFEKFKIPAFTLMDSALAALYAFNVQNACVVDVGHKKVDVTAVSDYAVVEIGRGVAIPECGGQALTDRLYESLAEKGFTKEMCEQLKQSSICEILPVGTPLPGGQERESQDSNPAAIASTGATRKLSMDDARDEATMNGEEGEAEGVLDVASIVASGKASEYLAQKEKEKIAKATTKKSGNAPDPGASAAKPVRLPNSKRDHSTFTFEEYIPQDDGTVRLRRRELEVGVERFFATNPGKTNHNADLLDTIAAAIHRTILSVPDVSARSALWDNLIIIGNGSKIRGFVPSLLAVLHQKYLLTPSNATIFTSELPSTFSTPLPTGGTNTPVPSGPPPSASHHPAAHGVNPLLVAATHASSQNASNTQQQQQQNQHLHPSSAADSSSTHGGSGVTNISTNNNNPNNPSTPGSGSGGGNTGQQQQHQIQHRGAAGHAQTPTSIKTVKQPEYFPEWKDSAYAGFEEAPFLGAQVAAKVFFMIDQGATKAFMTRSDWNENGPSGIHEFMMVA